MQQAIVIVENGADDGENHRVIGPFADGETASNWAFKNLEYGVQWYWLPLDAPVSP